MHPWVTGAADGPFDDGRYRQAVSEAARAIEVRLKMKAELDELTATSLVQRAFSSDPAKARLCSQASSRTQRSGPTDSWAPSSTGSAACSASANVLTHTDDDLNTQMAPEGLGALSLLARWIDEAIPNAEATR